ncbi:sensor histidine kinase [Saccharicrinis sp. FJH62]|uniref:sensor histidine kinase n=1 Tax=Saccharicrinis sp. FJH62 TaxID=3344657 RepID=UPI0035D3F566
MPIKIALIISVVLQFAAAFIAITLIRRTRNNVAWWLISLGFLLMAFRRVFEIMQVYNSESALISGFLGSWTGVLISVIMLLSLIYIKRIFNIQKQFDELRQKNESRVLSAIVRTEEKERQHLSKELHDGLGPLLSSVKMTISTCRFQNNQNPTLLENAEKLIDESIFTLKDISNNLSPHILVNFGLLKALNSFIGKLKIIDEPNIHLKNNIKEQRFPFNVEVVLYRVICELINNTLKHADAKNIYIDLFAEGTEISLEYIDDGKGFDPLLEETEKTGQGLSNIRSRIKSLDGTFGIYSEPGEGVHVKSKIILES